MIEIKSANVKLTEQDLREILRAVEEAKENIEFIDEPMPDGDLSVLEHLRERFKRGLVIVRSYDAKVAFEIQLEVGGAQQESQGYRRITMSEVQG